MSSTTIMTITIVRMMMAITITLIMMRIHSVMTGALRQDATALILPCT